MIRPLGTPGPLGGPWGPGGGLLGALGAIWALLGLPLPLYYCAGGPKGLGGPLGLLGFLSPS